MAQTTDDIMVSVCMITYNHESFIREAIEGVLMQKTPFAFELVIGEDFSTDGTRSICEEYARSHPNVIRLLPADKNLGITPNFIRTLNDCIGKYIALCEGDDYWTDPLKIQKQVEFLEKNEEYSIIADNSITLNFTDKTEGLFSNLPERDIGINEILEKRHFATAGVLFRNFEEKLHPNGIWGDTILWCYLTKFGKIKYKPETTSVYRKHINGVTNTEKVKWAKTMETWNAALKKNHPYLNKSIFIKRNFGEYKIAAKYALQNKNYRGYLFCTYKCIQNNPSEGLIMFLQFIQKWGKRKLNN